MLLDTNVVSAFLKPRASKRFPAIDRFVREVLEQGNLGISFVTQFELRRGLEELGLQGNRRRRAPMEPMEQSGRPACWLPEGSR